MIRFSLSRFDCSSSLPSVALKSQSVQSSQASRTPQVLKHGILENTSIAGVSLLNGDRRVIFQQTDGNLRQAIYSKEGSTWAADSGAVIQNARNHTPLAVVNSYVDDLLETSVGNIQLLNQKRDRLTLTRYGSFFMLALNRIL